jgi:hypothetical protein
LVVLYNGERRWNAMTETRNLIRLSPDSSLWYWQSQVRYCLVDIGAISGKELVRRSSLVALLFRFEQLTSPKGLKVLAGEVKDWFKRHKGCESLRRLFAELLREAFARHGMALP